MATKPNVTWVIQQGLKAHSLVETHRTKVEPRLEAGLLDGLANDVKVVTGAAAAPKTKATEAKAATQSQNDALAVVVAIVTAIRTAVTKDPDTTATIRKGYGVGTKLNANSVTSALAAADTTVTRAKGNPAEARLVGVLDTDIEALEGAVATLTKADGTQEAARASKPLSTKARNELVDRIYRSVKKIAGAGVLAFALDKETRDAFDKLDDLPKKSPKKKPA